MSGAYCPDPNRRDLAALAAAVILATWRALPHIVAGGALIVSTLAAVLAAALI